MPVAEIALIICYSAFFIFLIFRGKLFKHFDIPPLWIAIIFIVKVIAGIFYGDVYRIFYGGGDTLDFFRDSEKVFGTLSKDPWVYLRLVFGNCFDPAPDLAPYHQLLMFYSTPGDYFMVRFNSIFRLFSFGYYNVHVVFYNFITLIGIFYLFRFCAAILPGKKALLAIAIFIFPSVLFWSSGIHKDGFTLSGFGLILFSTHRLLSLPFNRNGFRSILKYLILLSAGFWLLHYRHPFWLLAFIPAWLAFSFTQKFPRYSVIKFVALYILFFVVEANIHFLFPSVDLFQLLSQSQQDFSKLREGSINLPLHPINGSFYGFIAAVPSALMNSFFKPFFNDIETPLHALAATENVVLILLVIAGFIWREKNISLAAQNLFLFCLFFSISLFIITGEIIPVVGVLVRYKMPAELFLLIAVCAVIQNKIPSKTNHQL